MECGSLPKNVCLFAIMTSGEDEDHVNSCQKLCGVDHLIADGVSPEGCFSKDFIRDMCSPACCDNCRGVVALFAKVAEHQAMECGLLPKNVCLFAIMTSGEDEGHVNSCQKLCGVDHLIADGVSPEGCFSKDFIRDMCSPACCDNCRGVVALFAKVAEHQGQHLPQLCEKHALHPHVHRAVYEVSSSDDGVAATPAAAPQAADAPMADAPATAFDDDYA
ncbi:UNVERIFIED_CONTAM: hypothetical protein Sindi_1781200 [Sesamum indicum]